MGSYLVVPSHLHSVVAYPRTMSSTTNLIDYSDVEYCLPYHDPEPSSSFAGSLAEVYYIYYIYLFIFIHRYATDLRSAHAGDTTIVLLYL